MFILVFNSMGNGLVMFVIIGKLNFKFFIVFIVLDLVKILVCMVMMQVVKGIGFVLGFGVIVNVIGGVYQFFELS